MLDPVLGGCVYFDPAKVESIKLEWFERGVRFLEQSGIPIRQIDVEGSSLLDMNEIHNYPKAVPTLRSSLASDKVTGLHLSAHRIPHTNIALKSEACASIDTKYGYAYLGVPPREDLDHHTILLQTLEMVQELPEIRYGIAFTRSAHQAPAFYARGMLGGTGQVPKEDQDTRDRIFSWFGEIRRQRRHLVGGFRSIYPAQLLSEAHRQVKVAEGPMVKDLGFGTWTQLEGGLWLWELDENELPKVKQMMDKAGLLLAA
jgi:hypothetical protein